MNGSNPPLFSIVTPVYDPPIEVLRDTIESVLAQTFTDWEWVLVDDRSPNPHVLEVLREYEATDPRLRVIARESNGRIVATSNDAVAAARGEFLVFLDHDDLLTPNALARVAEAIGEDDEVDYVYSDEDKVSESGDFYDTFSKPDWSPERLRWQMYTGHLSVMRASIVRSVGGFREGFDGSQDHDLTLRVTELARSVAHIREVLYHWRAIPGSAAADPDAKPYAWEAGRKAINEHLQRVGINAHAELGQETGAYRVVREPVLDRTVSVIIPTRGSKGTVHGEERVFVTEAVRSLLSSTRVRELELVVVYDLDTPQEVLDELREIAGERLNLVPFSGPFNFSRKCNLGFLAARGDVVLFVNDDVEAISDEVIGSLVAPLSEPDVGMTGAMLYFEDMYVQHGGHQYHDGQFTHAYQGTEPESLGRFRSLILNREAPGLTAACIAMPREVFSSVGGFSEQLPGNFNDVDLSNKVRMNGYRLLWLADVKLFHFESRSRDSTVRVFEHQLVLQRWGNPEYDPFLA